MKNILLAGLATLALAACAQNPTTGAAEITSVAPVSATTLRSVIAEGQLLCSAGPATVAMFSTSGAAILAKGATKSAVDAVCAILGAVAVSPVGAPVGTVSVALPPSLVIPLKS